MTSTDLRVENGPLKVVRRLRIRSLIVALALAVAALAYSAAPVFAEETTSTTSTVTTSTESSTSTEATETGYSQTPEIKKEPEKGSGYSQKPKAPKKAVAPAKEKTEPVKEPSPSPVSEPVAKAETLPFTGYDLRWVVAIGLLLVAGGGLSLWLLRRRERHSGSR